LKKKKRGAREIDKNLCTRREKKKEEKISKKIFPLVGGRKRKGLYREAAERRNSCQKRGR